MSFHCSKSASVGIPWQLKWVKDLALSLLWVWSCPGTSTCHRCDQKNKTKQNLPSPFYYNDNTIQSSEMVYKHDLKWSISIDLDHDQVQKQTYFWNLNFYCQYYLLDQSLSDFFFSVTQTCQNISSLEFVMLCFLFGRCFLLSSLHMPASSLSFKFHFRGQVLTEDHLQHDTLF